MNPLKSVILAAGKGTRLEPITTNRPKHILEIAGKSILQRIIDSLVFIEYIDEIIIVTHHYESQIKAHIAENYSDVRSKFTYVFQKEPNGTGGALQAALPHLNTTEPFLVIYGDLIVGRGISEIIQLYTKDPSKGYILGTKVDHPENYGCLQLSENRVTDINEKNPDAPKDSLINAGVYIFPSNVQQAVQDLSLSDRGELELTDVIKADKVNEYVVCELSEGWFDIGRPWELINANEYLIGIESENYQILGDVEESVHIKGNVHVAKTARLLSGTYIEGDVYIDEGAILGPNCYIRGLSYVGKNVRIGNACEIKNSLIYEGTHAAHLSYVGDSVIGMNCNLGAGTITANLRHDNGNVKFSVKNKRVVTNRRKLGVIMGDNSKTGIGVSILPGVKIKSGALINAGELISRDIF